MGKKPFSNTNKSSTLVLGNNSGRRIMNAKDNGFDVSIAQAIEEMKSEQGEFFSLEKINLAELGRRTGISRAKLRRLKGNGFKPIPHGLANRKSEITVLSRYEAFLNELLRQSVTNSSVLLKRLQAQGYEGSVSTVKRYVKAHRDLVPARRQIVAPQGNRGRRYTTGPGEAYQMDWGFTKVVDYAGNEYQAACFAMICHHCGMRYVEFFPNAKQESLFIGMIHAFRYMGVPKCVLTDNMKSVVLHRDFTGRPVWQKDYEAFMRTVGFQTKLCKPRHPFTKGKVERLVRFVKDNFLMGRIFWNVTDLNSAALEWCNEQNSVYHKTLDGVPQELHFGSCANAVSILQDSFPIRFYLCPERKISFDGFINYEGRRFGVPYSYRGATARIMRDNDVIYIYSADCLKLLTSYDVTWSRKDRFCDGQYPDIVQPEEFPSAPIKSRVTLLEEPNPVLSFEKFNFDREVDWDE